VRLDEGRASAELLAKLDTGPESEIQKTGTDAASARLGELKIAAQDLSTLHKLNELTGGADPALTRELTRAQQKKQALEAPRTRKPVALQPLSDGLSLTIGALPVVRCDVERASFRTGDRASFTLNYYDAPFDPRLMRSAAVEVLIGIMTPEEHDAGIHGVRRADGSRLSIVEDTPGLGRTSRFVGFIDKWNLHFSDSGAEIEASATDLMSLIRDTPLPADAEIDHDLPIDEGVTKLLQSFPALRGIIVTYGPEGASEPGPVPQSAAARRKKVVKKGKRRIRRNAENMTVWDHITDVCIGVGAIPVITGIGLRIETARTLYGQAPRVPRMVWGRNLLNLSFQRSMSGFKNPTIEVRSYSADEKQTFAARYPDPLGFGIATIGERDFPKQAARPARVTPGGQNPDDPIRVMTVSDVARTKLPDIARGLYEETARQEIEGSFSTEDPSTFGVDFQTADLLDLKAGDPIRIEIDARGQGEVADVVTELQGMTVPQRVARLEQAGFKRKVAIVYAALLDSSNLQTVFRVSGARVSFDHDEGLSFSVDFQNYITLRDDPSTADAVGATASAEARRRTAGQTGPAARRLRQTSEARKAAQARALEGLGTAPNMSTLEGEAYENQSYDRLYSDPSEPE
jgi:hypothetical protein